MIASAYSNALIPFNPSRRIVVSSITNWTRARVPNSLSCLMVRLRRGRNLPLWLMLSSPGKAGYGAWNCFLQRGLTRFSMKTITRRGRHRSSAGHQMFLLAGTQRSSWHFPRRNASIFKTFCSNGFRALAANEASEECLAVWLAYLSRSGFLPMGVAGTT